MIDAGPWVLRALRYKRPPAILPSSQAPDFGPALVPLAGWGRGPLVEPIVVPSRELGLTKEGKMRRILILLAAILGLAAPMFAVSAAQAYPNTGYDVFAWDHTHDNWIHTDGFSVTVGDGECDVRDVVGLWRYTPDGPMHRLYVESGCHTTQNGVWYYGDDKPIYSMTVCEMSVDGNHTVYHDTCGAWVRTNYGG